MTAIMTVRNSTIMMELVMLNQCTFSLGEPLFRYTSQRSDHSTELFSQATS
jgi:hypothetical protein